MPTQHFLATDVMAILAAFCMFSMVVFLPGYALGWLTNALRFRTRTLTFRFAASVPLALATGPILAFTVGRSFSLTAVLALNGLLSGIALYLFARDIMNGTFSIPARRLAPFLGLIAVWIVIAMALLTDWQFGHRLYYSVIAFDYAVRTEFTQAISTYGIPAQNPFYFPGHAVFLRYHYFWMILCASIERLGAGAVDARQAFVAGTLWCGIGLICLIPVYLRAFSPQGAANLRRRSLIGIALLGVTGLDILGALFMLLLTRMGFMKGMSPSVEWWNNQVDGWLYTMLWEPHYLCAVVACFTGFLVLWDVPEAEGLRPRLLPGMVAGLAFASAAGCGIYVAMVFAVFLVLWTGVTLLRRRYLETGMMAIAGLIAVVFTLAYLRTLSAAKGSGGQLLQLTVRTFDLVETTLRMFGFHRPWQILLGDLVTLPLNYFLELGVFSVVGWWAWTQFRRRERPATRQELAAFAMAGSSVVICTFVRSSVIANNDLGWRGFLIAQFALLLWAADMLAVPAAIPAATRSLLRVLLILGVAGVLYDLAILRFFPVLSDAGLVPRIAWMSADEQLGLRTYSNREAYEWLRRRTSPDVVIQQNPNVHTQDTFWGLYGQRRTLAEDQDCGSGFGGDPGECAPIFKRLDQLFSGGDPDGLEAACRALPVDVFIARDTDPAWRDHTSWVWNGPSLFHNDYVRLIPCQTGAAAPRVATRASK